MTTIRPKIIDVRARPNIAEYMRIFQSAAAVADMQRFGFPVPPTVTLAEFIEEMDRLGIEKIVYSGRQAEYFSVTNDHVSQTAVAYPDRIVGFGSLDLTQDTRASLAEIARCQDQLGLRGIALDQARLSRMVDDRRYYPIYLECERRGLPLIFTFGPLVNRYLDFGSPVPVDHVAADFPNLKILCAHGTWPWITEMIAIAFRHDNVFFDASAWFRMPGHEMLVEAVNSGVVTDKLLFGSALPFNPLKAAIDDFLALGWREDALPRIMHDNAERFLS